MLVSDPDDVPDSGGKRRGALIGGLLAIACIGLPGAAITLLGSTSDKSPTTTTQTTPQAK